MKAKCEKGIYDTHSVLSLLFVPIDDVHDHGSCQPVGIPTIDRYSLSDCCYVPSKCCVLLFESRSVLRMKSSLTYCFPVHGMVVLLIIRMFSLFDWLNSRN